MPNMGAQELLLAVLAQLGVAAGIWGGIRADIRNMKEQIRKAAQVADDAHDRIDSILAGGNDGSRRHTSRRHTDPPPT